MKDIRKCIRVNKRYKELINLHGSYEDSATNAKELFYLGLVYENDISEKEIQDTTLLLSDIKFMEERINIFIEDEFIDFANKKYIEKYMYKPFSKIIKHYVLIGISLRINILIKKIPRNRINNYYNIIEKIRNGEITYENYKSNYEKLYVAY